MKAFRLLFLLALVISGLPMSARAETGRIVKAPNGAVTVYGLTPRGNNTVGLGSVPRRRVKANTCGLLVIRASALYPVGTVEVDGATVDPAALQTNTLPTCRNSALVEPRPAAFKTSNNAIALTGKAPGQTYVVSYPNRSATQQRKANICGLVRFTSVSLGSTLQLPTTTGALAAFEKASLPVFAPPLCYKGLLYIPANWPPPLAQSVASTTTSNTTNTSTNNSNTTNSNTTNTSTNSSNTNNSNGTPITLSGPSKTAGGTIIFPGLTRVEPDSTFRLEWFTASGSFLSASSLGSNACGFSALNSNGNAAMYKVYEVWDGDYRVVWTGDTMGMPVLSVQTIGCVNGQAFGYN